MPANFVMHPQKLAEVLRGPQGPVVRRLLEDGELVKDEARRLVRVHTPVPGERRARKPGTLRDTTVKRVVERGGEVVVQVGSSDPITGYEHDGTPPHVITGRPLLVFYWPKVGRVVAFPRVNHPGTTGSRFLVRALDVLRRRY